MKVTAITSTLFIAVCLVASAAVGDDKRMGREVQRDLSASGTVTEIVDLGEGLTGGRNVVLVVGGAEYLCAAGLCEGVELGDTVTVEGVRIYRSRSIVDRVVRSVEVLETLAPCEGS